MKTTLKNDLLTVTIDNFGAEVHSITDNRTGHEYLWCGDKKFWGRHSPVLFPLVGQVWEGRYRMDDQEYRLGQHGFARDREFELIADTSDDEVWFVLESDDRSMELFPRRFRLEIGYRLYEARLSVIWRVKNLDDKTMHFHIGAHPAFNYPDYSPADDVHGYLCFDSREVTSEILGTRGCVVDGEAVVELDNEGMIPLDAHTFDRLKTIIIDKGQVRRVSMLNKHREAYLTLLFHAPLVGIWSPSVEAPFVCIEPWWGRCDREGFAGDFAEREYTNRVDPGETFEASYMILFDRI